MPNYEFDPIKKVLHKQQWLPIWIRVIRWDRIWPQSLKVKFWFGLVPLVSVYGLANYRDIKTANLWRIWLAKGDPAVKAELARRYNYIEPDEKLSVK